MTREEFRDAIAKGLGRVPQYLRAHPGQPYRDIIREACVKNLAWDSDSEGHRAEYLFEIMTLSGEYEALATQVLHVLRTSDDGSDVLQAFPLAALIAARGNADARAAMYERFDNSDASWGAEAILKLDRANGLYEMLRRLGRRILAGEDVAIDGFILWCARDELGEDFRERLLKPVVATDAEIRACLEAMDKEDRKERTSPKLWSMSYPDMKQALEAVNGRVGMGLQFWVKAASEGDVRKLAQDLLSETRPDFVLAYLRAFFRSAFPLELSRLFEIAEKGEDKLSHAAMLALEAVQSQNVREFGVDLLRHRHRLNNAFGLFRRNYQPGDQALFTEVLQTISPEPELAHHIGLDLCSIYKDRNLPEAREPLTWAYEQTPCSMCRESSFKILVDQQLAPIGMIRECLDDCSLETRELARKALSKQQTE